MRLCDCRLPLFLSLRLFAPAVEKALISFPHHRHHHLAFGCLPIRHPCPRRRHQRRFQRATMTSMQQSMTCLFVAGRRRVRQAEREREGHWAGRSLSRQPAPTHHPRRMPYACKHAANPWFMTMIRRRHLYGLRRHKPKVAGSLAVPSVYRKMLALPRLMARCGSSSCALECRFSHWTRRVIALPQALNVLAQREFRLRIDSYKSSFRMEGPCVRRQAIPQQTAACSGRCR